MTGHDMPPRTAVTMWAPEGFSVCHRKYEAKWKRPGRFARERGLTLLPVVQLTVLLPALPLPLEIFRRFLYLY